MAHYFNVDVAVILCADISLAQLTPMNSVPHGKVGIISRYPCLPGCAGQTSANRLLIVNRLD